MMHAPYSRVPRIQANALYPIGDTNFQFVFDSEAVNFLREIGPTGGRLNLSPRAALVGPRAGVLLRARRGLRLHPI